MFDRDPDAFLTHTRYEQTARDWTQPALALHPWCDPQAQGQQRSRFGGFERQIEAEVLQNWQHLGH
ncbi:hypothetical protein [Thiocystis violacea]|uniref:hypothetical protein n=1 Tax=Thiocystis violacea TaxID=13725 RepID=UPI001902C811|nr:hypothetical protein [Thiocystis violacea]